MHISVHAPPPASKPQNLGQKIPNESQKLLLTGINPKIAKDSTDFHIRLPKANEMKTITGRVFSQNDATHQAHCQNKQNHPHHAKKYYVDSYW